MILIMWFADPGRTALGSQSRDLPGETTWGLGGKLGDNYNEA